jgi:hypothetical protein
MKNFMKKNLFRIIITVFMLLVVVIPVSSFAQGNGVACPDGTPMPLDGNCNGIATTVTCTATGLGGVICQLNQLLNSLLPLLVTLGIAYFAWGVIQYVIAGGEEAKTKGRDQIIYGIIGLAVIVGVWGLVSIVTKTFGLSGSSLQAPTTALVAPVPAGTCSPITSTSTFAHVLNYFTCVIDKSVIPFIFALAMVFFVWGAVKFFIINSDEEAKREQGKQFMLWGIIALAVMISVWGLVNILRTTFGFGTGSFLPSVGTQEIRN